MKVAKPSQPLTPDRAEEMLHALPDDHLAVANKIIGSPLARAAAIKGELPKLDNPERVLQVCIDYEVTHKNRKPTLGYLRDELAKYSKVADVEVTTEAPKDPEWEDARQTCAEMDLGSRIFLRSQVKLGLILAAKKKVYGVRRGAPKKNSADSAKLLTWEEKVLLETGYSRRQSDEFIRMGQAALIKIQKSKKLALPAPAKKDVLAIFKADVLTLTPEQWAIADDVIATETHGETQASLLQHLGRCRKPAPMPAPDNSKKAKGEESTAGQLAHHFFEPVFASIIKARTAPGYKDLLYALPLESDEEHPISLATMEAELLLTIADLREVREKIAKPTTGRVIK